MTNRRATLFSKEDKHETVSRLVLNVSHPSARSLDTGLVAQGQYDVAEARWFFECDEPSTKRWLETTFSQPINVIGGQLSIDSIDFVTHVRDVIMHRKGLTLEIRQKLTEK